jgi:hypothetical protein
MNDTVLILLLRAAAAGHLAIALLSTQLVRLLHWEEDVKRMSLLVREVFQLHGWFIALTLTFFGILTWRFAAVFAAGGNELAAWLAGGIAVFWGLRVVMQWTHYSREHWRGKPRETAAHWTLTLIYGAWTVLYAMCAIR